MTFLKKHFFKIATILLSVGVIFLAFNGWQQREANKALKKDNKELLRQEAELQKEISAIEKVTIALQDSLNLLATEKEIIENSITQINEKLNEHRKKYRDVPAVNNLPLNEQIGIISNWLSKRDSL